MTNKPTNHRVSGHWCSPVVRRLGSTYLFAAFLQYDFEVHLCGAFGCTLGVHSWGALLGASQQRFFHDFTVLGDIPNLFAISVHSTLYRVFPPTLSPPSFFFFALHEVSI